MFHLWKKYLYPVNDELLVIMHNLHFQIKKNWADTVMMNMKYCDELRVASLKESQFLYEKTKSWDVDLMA